METSLPIDIYFTFKLRQLFAGPLPEETNKWLILMEYRKIYKRFYNVLLNNFEIKQECNAFC